MSPLEVEYLTKEVEVKVFFGKCFRCNKYVDHRSYECLENYSTNQGSAHIIQDKDEGVESPSHEYAPKVGETYLMIIF